MVDRSSLLAYLDRPWAALEEQTEQHRVATYQRDPAWSWRTAAALRQAVCRAQPSWPTPADRAADFEHHVRLRSLLDQVADELTRRRRAG